MTVTIEDIARSAGVSKGTVSFVLNDRKSGTVRISPATKKKILEAAQRLNYKPSFSARALARGKTDTIGFMCGNIRNPHYTEMADLAMREVEKRGYHLMIGVNEWVEQTDDLRCFDALMDRGVDGMIFFGMCLQPHTSQYRRVVDNEFPLVSISEHLKGLPCIKTDWQTGMNQAMAHLKSMGHRRVGFCSMEHGEKQAAIEAAAANHGMELVHHHVVEAPGWCHLTPLYRQAGIDVAQNPDRPTAMILSSDFVAMRFINGAIAAGLRIPEDLSIIGMDGTEMGEFLNPPLTSIGQDIETIITRAVEMIIQMIEGKKSDPAVHIIPSRLLIRNSVRQLNGKE